MEFLGVTILQGVEFSIFLIDFEWALQQCSATALPVITMIFTKHAQKRLFASFRQTFFTPPFNFAIPIYLKGGTFLSLRKRGNMFLPALVCLFLCLSVCDHNNKKNCGRIYTKFYGKVPRGKRVEGCGSNGQKSP